MKAWDQEGHVGFSLTLKYQGNSNMTHCEYPVLSRIFLQWLFVERLVTLSNAEAFFIEMIQSIDFGTDENNEKGF